MLRHTTIGQELLKNKAEVNAGDNEGATPLHWAVIHNDTLDILGTDRAPHSPAFPRLCMHGALRAASLLDDRC